MLPGKCFVCHLCQGFVSQRGRSVTRFLRLFRDGATAFSLLALMGLLALKVSNQPETIKTGPFYAIDGDTLDDNGERLRLVGIDAPEYRQQCQRDGRAWACGQAARAALVKIIAARLVECRGARRDKYGRLLVTCRSGETDINAEIVRRGMAISYGGYVSEEAAAREAKAGLWAGSFERPQDYRHEQAAMRDDPPSGVTSLIGRLLEWN
jgi:endonuclease YncB( thermonuclease family)